MDDHEKCVEDILEKLAIYRGFEFFIHELSDEEYKDMKAFLNICIDNYIESIL